MVLFQEYEYQQGPMNGVNIIRTDDILLNRCQYYEEPMTFGVEIVVLANGFVLGILILTRTNDSC